MMTRKIGLSVAGAAVLATTLAALAPALGIGVAPVSAASRKGDLTITKNCDNYDFAAYGFCTLTHSSLPELQGATVFYHEPPNTPTAGMLDSNIVVVAGPGDWAVGRCTLDLSTSIGLCTFSDGVGRLAGFRARLDVAPIQGLDFSWIGTYSFKDGNKVR